MTLEFFNTNTIAAELESLEHAISTMELQLSQKSLFGIATLILELFQMPNTEGVRIAITEHQTPNMFEDMVGEERWIHVSVLVQPGNRLLDVTENLFPARKLSEGCFEAQRNDPIIQETLAMWGQNHELAQLRLAQHLIGHFRTVAHRTGVAVLKKIP